MPDELKNILYLFGFVLIVSRFLGGTDFGAFKIPSLPPKKIRPAMWSGVAILAVLLLYDNKNYILNELFLGNDFSHKITRITPSKPVAIHLSDGENLHAHLEQRIYAQHNYVYLRFSGGSRMQLYKFQSKAIGSKGQGCTIELVNYGEVPVFADVKVLCP